MHNNLIYEQNYQIKINTVEDSLFYHFDYDERSYQVNMDFQHFHSFYEIHILLSPKACHIINGIPYDIKMNDIVLLRPSLLHKTVYSPGLPSKRLIISFILPESFFLTDLAFQSIFKPFCNAVPIYRFDQTKTAILNLALNEIFQLSKKLIPDELKKILIHHKFVEFLHKLWELDSLNIYVKEDFENDLNRKIYDITFFIHNHYQEDITLEKLAKQFYISPYYLSHQFKKVTGYTLTHYIQMTRIRNAQFALINTHSKITEIATNCGFTSFSQFNRVFQKFCMVSPSDFRKSNQPYHE